MIGDAPGDLKAAKDNGASFFPVIPGREENSWGKLLNEGLDKFLKGTFKGTYQDGLLEEFGRSLPHIPPWEK